MQLLAIKNEPAPESATVPHAEACVCGLAFVMEANFCHKCGTPRASCPASNTSGAKKEGEPKRNDKKVRLLTMCMHGRSNGVHGNLVR